jgi:hypothetical protein
MRVEVNPGWHVDTALRKKPFYPGEQFGLDDDKEANRLIRAGVVTAVKGEAPGASGGGGQLNVTKTVELVVAAQTIEELDKLAEGETRKGVQDAITKRRAELTPPE